MFSNPGVTLNNSILDGDHKFAVSSMEVGLRCAGPAEFAGLDALPDYQRARVIGRLAKRMLPELNTSTASEWMGSRPATPDSLPCIGSAPDQKELFVAFGHGHLRSLGTTLATGTHGPVSCHLGSTFIRVL